jgi:hypothetical protein
MKTIELTQGLVAIIDDIDFEEVALKKWCAVKNRNVWYAVNGKGEKKMFMHRLILRAIKGQKVDHRDGNGLNNQRANIRLASASQNGANRQVLSKKSSQYLGVYKVKEKYQAGCRKDGLLHRSQLFKDEKDAAKAYNDLAQQLHGSFAKLNQL